MITLNDFTAEERKYYGIKDTAHLGTLDALVRCRWFRDGWGRAHKACEKPCLQTHEERLFRRAMIADKRTLRAMQAHDAANMYNRSMIKIQQQNNQNTPPECG